jgi:excisionase family DNA binding protein
MTTRGEKDKSVRPGSGPRLASEPPAHRSEPLLRPTEVARLLACSSKTVYAWAASGVLPCVRLGRLVRFRADDVRQFVEAHAERQEGRAELYQRPASALSTLND